MSEPEPPPQPASKTKQQPVAEGLRFGRGIITGRVLTVLIVSMVGTAISLALVFAIR